MMEGFAGSTGFAGFRNSFAGHAGSGSGHELSVVGRPCHFHRDDAAAQHLSEGKELIVWRGNGFGDRQREALLIDRFDGRAHLADYHEFVKMKSMVSRGEEEEGGDHATVLDQERYGDLPGWPDDPLDGEPEPQPDPVIASGAASGAAAADPSHGSTAAAQAPAGETHEEEESPFSLPFQLPVHITEVPQTAKAHKIMAHTAAKTRKSRQLEILLKVKQADNPTLAFLEAGHALHPYYVFLRDEDPQPRQTSGEAGEAGGASEGASRNGVAAKPGLGLLGADYFETSSSDEDGGEEVANQGTRGRERDQDGQDTDGGQGDDEKGEEDKDPVEDMDSASSQAAEVSRQDSDQMQDPDHEDRGQSQGSDLDR